MFCEKCGKPTDMDKTLCDECAAKAEVPQEPETIVLDQVEQPKKQKKTGLLIGIVAAVAALAVLVVVLCLGPLKGLWIKNFGSPAEYMLYVEEKAVAAGVQSFVQLYGDYMEQIGDMDEKHLEAEAHILLGDKLLTLLEQAMASEGTQMQLDFLSDITVDMSGDWTKESFGGKLDLGLGDKHVIGLETYISEQDKTSVMGIPVLNSQYLQYATENSGYSNPAKTYAMYQLLPSAAKLGAVLETYTGIMLKYLDKVETTTETVTVEGVSQKLTVLTLTVTAEDMSKMAIEILQTAQTDKDLEAVLDALSDYVNAVNEQQYEGFEEYAPEKVDLHAEMIEGIPDAIEQIQTDESVMDQGNYLQLTDYVDESHNLRGRTVEVFTENVSEGSVHYLTVTDGSKNALVVDMTQIEDVQLYIVGEYEDNDGTVSGSFDISVENVNYMTVEASSSKEKLQLKLTPTDAFMTDVMELDGDSSALLGLASPCLEIISSGNDEAGKVEMYLKAGDAMLAGVTMDATLSDEVSLTPPQGPYVDGDDDDALAAWSGALNYQALMDNLVAAGVPEELIQNLLMALMYAK